MLLDNVRARALFAKNKLQNCPSGEAKECEGPPMENNPFRDQNSSESIKYCNNARKTIFQHKRNVLLSQLSQCCRTGRCNINFLESKVDNLIKECT